MADGTREVWAATSSWRGDLKFFGRIVQRARDEVRSLGHSDDCRIEFAVGPHDVDRYESVEGMLVLAPADTLRKFRSARVQVGGDSLCVEMSFGRGLLFSKKGAFTCPPGIAVEVSSHGAVEDGDLKAVRDAIVAVLQRGAFFWAKKPLLGPSPGGPTREEARDERWGRRERCAWGAFLAMALVLWSAWAAIGYFVLGGEDSGVFSGGPDPTFIGGVAAVVSVLLAPFSTRIFPAIEIADVTPGRRILQTIGGSGIVTTAIGVGGAYLKTLFA